MPRNDIVTNGTNTNLQANKTSGMSSLLINEQRKQNKHLEQTLKKKQHTHSL